MRGYVGNDNDTAPLYPGLIGARRFLRNPRADERTEYTSGEASRTGAGESTGNRSRPEFHR
jgi:hypothetical protein